VETTTKNHIYKAHRLGSCAI